MFTSECTIPSCQEHFIFKHSERPPDMYVIVDYGEYDREGRMHEVGRLGQTEVVQNQHIADYKRQVLSHKKEKGMRGIMSNGYYIIQIYDSDGEAELDDFIGKTIVNVTDLGLHSDVKADRGSVTFEVFANQEGRKKKKKKKDS